MVCLNSVNALGARVDNISGTAGAPRISGLKVRPPCVSQEEYDAATARGEPDFTMRGAMAIMRPVTEEMAEAEKLIEGANLNNSWTRK